MLAQTVMIAGLLGQIQSPDGRLFTDAARLPDIEVYYSVYCVDFKTETVKRLYKSTVRVLEVDHPPDSDTILISGHGNKSFYVEDLIDVNGKFIRRLDRAIDAVFIDTQGERVAYVKGTSADGDELTTEGTWILDLKTNKEEKICEGGYSLQWSAFDHNLYICKYDEGQGGGYRYSVDTGELTEADFTLGEISPGGTYEWQFESGSGVKIIHRRSGCVISDGFELLRSHKDGRPYYWMTDRIVMVPYEWGKSEDFLLFADSGRSLKAPGRVLGVTSDERYVYVCKPGLVLEKMAIERLEVVYAGTPGTTNP